MIRLFNYKPIMTSLILMMFCSSFIYYCFSFAWEAKSNGITIVIDAGHGGRDGGCVGVNGTIEKEINLKYAFAIKGKLLEKGYRVVLTRETDDGLYSEFATNKKVSDMNSRMEIIKRANPSLVISVHMNSFSDSRISGANCFYKVDDEASKQCANYIQKSLHDYCGAKNKTSKPGDYFMLNCSYYTSILIECGFLSNEEDEKKLNTTEYMDKIVNSIYSGVLLYFGK